MWNFSPLENEQLNNCATQFLIIRENYVASHKRRNATYDTEVPKEEEHPVHPHVADIEANRTASRAAELEKQREPEKPKEHEKRKNYVVVTKESQKEHEHPKLGVTHKESDITRPRHGSSQREVEKQKHGEPKNG